MRAFLAAVLLATAMPVAASVPPAPAPVAIDAPIVTHHDGVFNGRRIAYEARVEPFVVRNADGVPAARIVTTSYVAQSGDAASRPVLFAFNGGPIAPSVTFHMSAFGPMRVDLPDDPTADLSDLPLVPNRHALLDVADIVLFDPANTGYSRTLEGIAPDSYFSVDADGQQLAALVMEWTRAHGREGSPVYLVGTSYGTMRAAAGARHLHAAGRTPAGIILFGQALNIIEYAQRPDNIVSYAVSLPTLAATAWAHDRADRRGRDFDAFMREAENYGAGEYLATLFLGSAAPAERRRAVAERLEAFTGLAADTWLARDLKIAKSAYLRLLFPGEALDHYDSRYRYPAEEAEPALRPNNVFAPAHARYLAETLGAGGRGAYALDNPATGGINAWGWGANVSPFGDWPYVAEVRAVMEADPAFRVFVANGYHDTLTTTGAMDLMLAHSGWPADRVRSARYQGGHMFYAYEPSLRLLMRDLREMLAN